MNIFIRTTIAPYRIDTYNALHERLNMKMCFYNRAGGPQSFDPGALEEQCRFKPVYLKGITIGHRDSRKICFGIWKMLRKEKPEIVIVPEFQFCTIQVLLFRWLTRRKFKVVSMTDDSFDMVAGGNDFTKLHGKLRRRLPTKLDELIVVSPEVENWYREQYGKGIWLPIILDDKRMEAYYSQLLPESRRIAEQFGLQGKKVLLYVGRLVELKNLSRVLEAFDKCRSDATFVIVGDGPERETLEKQAKTMTKPILFTGRFEGDSLYAWYNISSALVLASYQEAFGAVTGEALLAGNRVIVSKKCGSSCLVSKDNGQLVDPFDVDGIASAIDCQMELTEVPDLLSSRDSLMPVSFDERIGNLVNRLKS